MVRTLALVAAVIAATVAVGAARAAAVESDPLPVPKDGARERAVAAYNDGVKRMLEMFQYSELGGQSAPSTTMAIIRQPNQKLQNDRRQILRVGTY